MNDETKSDKVASDTPAKKPASFRRAFAIVTDIRKNASELRKQKFPDKTPEPLIYIFAQCKRLVEVLRGLEKPQAAADQLRQKEG